MGIRNNGYYCSASDTLYGRYCKRCNQRGGIDGSSGLPSCNMVFVLKTANCAYDTFSDIISLAINLIFKFVTPHFGLALDRTWEMIVGTAVPVILLAGIEVVLKAKEFIAPEYMAYISGRNVRMRQENAGDTEESKRTDRFTQKVLGIGLGLSGVLITVLGFIAEENIVVPVAVGLVVTLIGIYLLILSLRRLL